MSQRGPAPRPGSRRSSSQSPPRDTQSSPTSPRYRVRPRDDNPRRDPPLHEQQASRPPTGGEERVEPAHGRAFGVPNILNHPSEARGTYIGAEQQQQPLPRVRNDDDRPSSGSVASGQYGLGTSPARPFPGQGQIQGPSQGQRSPMAPRTGGPNLPPSAMSPYALPPPPGEINPLQRRRILTPKSPRTASLGRAVSSFMPFGPHSAQRGGPSHQGIPPVPPMTGSHMQGGPHAGPPGTPSTTVSAVATPPRSFSQPLHGLGTPAMQAQELGQLPGGLLPPRDQQGRPPLLPPGPGYMPGPPQGRAMSASGPSGGPTGDGQWSSALIRSIQAAGRSGLPLTEAQQFITITPSYGEEIHVPVDIHQASKQADEKRLRNAGASARFRARKKEKDKEVQLSMQRLESQNRELQKRLQELEVERDFYRSERNRLRQIMYHHAELRDIAEAAPPSPPSAAARSGGDSFAAESSPLSGQHRPAAPPRPPPPPGHPPPPPPAVPTYVSDTLERPARRRRTDPAPSLEFGTPVYGPPMPTTLPPIPHPGYSMAPSPLSGSPGQQRLPPLRMDQPVASPSPEQAAGIAAPPPPTRPPPQYQTQSYVPHEGGWVSGPRPPHDTGQQ